MLGITHTHTHSKGKRKGLISPFLVILCCLIFPAGSFSTEIQKAVFLFGEGGIDYSSHLKTLNSRIGQIDLFGLLTLGRAESFAEIVFEPEETGEYFIDVERLYVGYMFDNLLNIRVGRFHTPFGYFTRVWHHGLYLMPQISRPTIIEFEDMGGPLPIHIIGIEAEGKIYFSESQNTGYIINFGNGNLQFGGSNIGDFDKYKTIIGKIYVSPLRYSEIGISLGYDPFSFPTGGTTVKNLILGGNLVYHKITGPMAIIEGFFFNELESKKTGFGGFALFSYGFPIESEWLYEIRPYLQVEFLDWQEGNPWFSAIEQATEHFAGRHIGYSAGARIGITPESAVKFEFEFMDRKNADDIWFLKLSVGFGLPIF